MTSNDDAERPIELTDLQLDQLLKAANEDLLDHVRRTADLSHPLAVIMSQTAAGNDLAALMIRMRSASNALARDLDRPRDLAFALFRDLKRARDLVRAGDRARDGIRGLTLADARAFAAKLGFDLGFDGDLERAVAEARARAVAEARAHCGALGLGDKQDRARAIAEELASIASLTDDLGRAGDSARALADDLGRAGDSARALADDLGRAGDSARALTEDLGRARAVDRARVFAHNLNRTFVDARTLADLIGAQPIDASGADLSNVKIAHLEILRGVVWTRETVWPTGIANWVRHGSREIGPGVYQVHLGNSPGSQNTVRV
jgi:hypothetical protein